MRSPVIPVAMMIGSESCLGRHAFVNAEGHQYQSCETFHCAYEL